MKDRDNAAARQELKAANSQCQRGLTVATDSFEPHFFLAVIDSDLPGTEGQLPREAASTA
jgi:hypothetical protein